MHYWPAGTTLQSLNDGATRPGVTWIARVEAVRLLVHDRWGREDVFDAFVATCQSWFLTTAIETEEALFDQKL